MPWCNSTEPWAVAGSNGLAQFKTFPSTCSGPEFIEGKWFKKFKRLKRRGIGEEEWSSHGVMHSKLNIPILPYSKNPVLVLVYLFVTGGWPR